MSLVSVQSIQSLVSRKKCFLTAADKIAEIVVYPGYVTRTSSDFAFWKMRVQQRSDARIEEGQLFAGW